MPRRITIVIEINGIKWQSMQFRQARTAKLIDQLFYLINKINFMIFSFIKIITLEVNN